MTTLRLAYGGPIAALAEALRPMTTVRLVGSNTVFNDPQRLSAFRADKYGADATTNIRLSRANPNTRGSLANGEARPALLVSYAYWRQFASERAKYAFRDYALDSGAYTVKMSGGTVDLAQYIAFCQARLADDPQCAEVFALDVIGDPVATERNVEAMWRAGVPAIPCYHYREPEALLRQYASAYPKIALGGLAGMGVPLKIKNAWLQQVFARVWPKRIHGFGMASESTLMLVPFDSVDASSWEQGPAAFGSYKSMGRAAKAPRGKQINLRAEVEWYLKLERRVAQRWARELAKARAT